MSGELPIDSGNPFQSPATTRPEAGETSGPTGNIGMPISTEGIRHFRTMLETTAQRISAKEIDELIESLRPAK